MKKRYNVIDLNQFMHDASSFEEFINLKHRQGWRYLNVTPYGAVFEELTAADYRKQAEDNEIEANYP